MMAAASSKAPESSSQASVSAVKGTNHPSPNSPSLAQSVRWVPMEMVQLPMAMEYTRAMTSTKMGRAAMRLVTTRSILSERDSPARLRLTQASINFAM